jgi:hypothetical protein
MTEPLLSPTLNVVTINTDKMDENMTTVVKDINAVYNTMNVDWQPGKKIRLDIENEFEKMSINNVPIKEILDMLKRHPEYKSNQYYMIILPISDNFGGLGPSFLDDNWFFIQAKYDIRHPSHELGHCNGLDEFAVNIGLVPSTNRNSSVNEDMQYRSTNVMGYSNELKPPKLPLKDFFSWQMQIVRNRIIKQMNKK